MGPENRRSGGPISPVKLRNALFPYTSGRMDRKIFGLGGGKNVLVLQVLYVFSKDTLT